MYIVDVVDDFFVKLNKMQNDLAGFSQVLDNRSNKIPALLDAFEKFFDQSKKVNNLGNNAVEIAVKSSLENIQSAIGKWSEKRKADAKGREFIKSNEKYLVVMVFGSVKAGKSSLGNFFAGKKFFGAPFDNPYKKIAKPIFATVERGRDTGDIERDAAGDTWFTEGVTDTTGAIQYFTLSGMRWIDSPGTGAVSKVGDTKDMTKLVEEYLSYTDMCIFLMNSSEPGLQDDMQYMKQLSNEGQEALIVITKSDFQDEDVDDEGNLISTLSPKTAENRKLQEDDICKRVKEQYPEIDETKFRALSISTALANEAINAQDDEKFRQSNLDKLMKILGDKVSDNAIERKQANPRRQLNKFIDEVVNDLKNFDACVDEIYGAVDKYKADMSRISAVIVANVRRSVRNEVGDKSNEWNSQIKRGSTVGNSTVNSTISDILQRALNREINIQMRRIIEDFQTSEMRTMQANLSVGALEKKTTQISHTYTESYTVTRPPDGFFEHIGDIFGKTYYKTEYRDRTEYQTIDLGTNLDEFLDNLMPQVERYAKEQSDQKLAELRDNYFAERQKFASKMEGEINRLRAELLALKF